MLPARFGERAAATSTHLSQLSHGLTGRHGTMACTPDTDRTLTGEYGPRRTDRPPCIDLRIWRLGQECRHLWGTVRKPVTRPVTKTRCPACRRVRHGETVWRQPQMNRHAALSPRPGEMLHCLLITQRSRVQIPPPLPSPEAVSRTERRLLACGSLTDLLTRIMLSHAVSLLSPCRARRPEHRSRSQAEHRERERVERQQVLSVFSLAV